MEIIGNKFLGIGNGLSINKFRGLESVKINKCLTFNLRK